MAFVIGGDKKKQQDSLNMLGQPGSFQNIKSQLQQTQVQQPVQPQFKNPYAAPQQKDITVKAKKQKKRYDDGGVVQSFQAGGFVEEEEEVT